MNIPALALGAALQLQAASSSSPPPSGDEVEALISQGIEMRVQGNQVQAIALFSRAYALRPDARSAAQLGLAEQAAGQWVEAERHVSEALAASADAWVVRNRTALEGAYRVIQQHVGTLQFVGGVDGSRVMLDGEVVATLPLTAPLRVRTGSYTLEIDSPGYYRLSRQVSIAAGQITSEPIALRRIPSLGTTAEASSAPPASPVVTPTPIERPPARNGSIVPALAFGAGALVAATVAIAVLVDREIAASQYNAGCMPDMPTAVCRLIDRDTPELAVGIGGFALAAVLAGVGVYFGVRAARPARVAVGSGPGSVGASFAVRF